MPSRCNSTMEEAKTRVMCVHVRGRLDVTFVYVFSEINHIRAGSDIKGMWSRLLWRKFPSSARQGKSKMKKEGRFVVSALATCRSDNERLCTSTRAICVVAGVIDVWEASTGFGRLASKLCGNVSI